MHPGPHLPLSFPDTTLPVDIFMQEMQRAGFSLLVDQRGEQLPKALQHLAWRLADEERASGKPIPTGRRVFAGSTPPPEEIFQWWLHPVGMLCHVKKEGESGGIEVEAIAFEKLGFSPKEKTLVFAADGEGLESKRVKLIPGTKGWKDVVSLQEAGKMLPLAQWPCSGKLHVVSFAFLDMPNPRPVLDDILSAPQVELLAKNHAFNHIEKVLGPWREAVDRMSEEEGQWLRKEISNQVGDVFHFNLQGIAFERCSAAIGKLGFSVPMLRDRKRAYKDNLVHSHASRFVQERILSGVPCPSEQERQHLRQWLEILQDRRSPRAMEGSLGRAFSIRVGEPKSGLHDLLLALPGDPGTLRKISWWIGREDPEVLEKLSTQPGPDGMTLPMHILRAWINVRNENMVQRKQNLRIGHARSCLEKLAEKISPGIWVLDSSSASLWDSFFQMKIFFPNDTDLIQAHQTAMKALITWVETARISLPDHLNVPGQGRFHLTDPGLAKAIDRAVQKGDAEDQGPALVRLDGYFRDLTPHLVARKMEEIIPPVAPKTSRPVRARF